MKTAYFLQPTIIKRRNVLGSASRPKLSSLKLSDKELLHEKSVECTNKDTFIKELTEQLEELKNKLYELRCEKEVVIKEKEKFELEIFEWKEAHKVEINILSETHGAEISDLNEKISAIEIDLKLLEDKNKSLNEEMEKLETVKHQEISSYKKEIEAKNIVIEHTHKTLEKLKDEKKNIQEKHKNEIELLKDKHLAELQSTEMKMLNSVMELQLSLDEQKLQSQLKVKELEGKFQNEINALKLEFNKEKEQIDSQNIVCISQLEEKMNEIKLISEIQCAEKCSELENYWRKKLENKEQESQEILKECQAISEYNIIQSEIEKNKYKSMFEENSKKYNILEKKYDDVYMKYKKLQSSFSDAQNKLYRLIKELREKKEQCDKVDQLLLEQQKFHTTISRCQQTIDILTNRLKESDMDVEQLKNELISNEKKMLELEHKLNIKSDEVKEFEKDNENNLKMAQDQISKVKEDLLAKVETYKLLCEKNRIREEQLQILMAEKEEYLLLIKKHQVLNLESTELLAKAEQEIERLTIKSSEQNKATNVLQRKIAYLTKEIISLESQKNYWSTEKKELELKVDILKTELKEIAKKEEEWQQCCLKLKQTEKEYENEKGKLLEKDSRIKELEQEVEALNIKYIKLEEINAGHIKTVSIN